MLLIVLDTLGLVFSLRQRGDDQTSGVAIDFVVHLVVEKMTIKNNVILFWCMPGTHFYVVLSD